MELKTRIQDFSEAHLAGTDLFLVGVIVSPDSKKIRVIVDGDQGVNLDTCAELSRALGTMLEEGDFIPHAYNLEVSSPGAAGPISLLRSMYKHIGRTFIFNLRVKTKVTGTLIAIDGDVLTLEETIKEKGKKAQTVQNSYNWADIKEAKIELSFK